MPIQVQGPDGQLLQFPDGTDRETMKAAMQKRYGAAQAPAQSEQTTDTGIGRLISGQPAGRVMVGSEDAATMPAWKNAAYGLVTPVADSIVGVGQMTGLMDDKTAQESMVRIDAVRGRTPGKVAGIAGDVGLMALPLSKIGALGKVAQYGVAGGAGAAYGATRGTREGESRGLNTVLSAGTGFLGQGASNLLVAGGKKAAAAIGPEVRALYEAAKARGIHLTPAQLSDSKTLKFLQSSLSRLPFSGTQGKMAAQKAQFNKELAKEIGVDAPVVTPEVYAGKKAADSAKFEELTSRNALKVDDGLIKKLEQIQNDAKTAGGDVLSTTRAVIDDFYARAQTGQSGIAVPGEAYQAFDSQLGQIAMKGTPQSHFVGRVKAVVRDAMDNSISPGDKAAWNQLRKEYGNRKTIRDLVAKGDGGEISPAALMGRVTANNAGKESMASGSRGGLGELARIGQRIKDQPSSGTAERMAPYLLGAGAVTNAPATLGLLAGGRATQQFIDSPLLAQIMLAQGRGQGQQFAGRYLARPAAAAIAPVTAEKKRNDARKRP